MRLVRQHGVYGAAVAIMATTIGMIPLVSLLWWTWLSLTSVPVAPVGANVRVQVKQREISKDAEKEKPGKTALLHVVCQVPHRGQWRDLLQLEDENSRRPDDIGSLFVREERVYLRPVREPPVPFGLLGEPPISVWLPAGKYEVLVVYPAARGFLRPHPDKPSPFPLASERVVQELPAGERTVVRVPLPHHEHAIDASLELRLHKQDTSKLSHDELQSLLAALDKCVSIPTPGGVLMDLPEPKVHHNEWHRDCEVDLHDLVAQPREWTRSQVQTVLYWLPPEAAEGRHRLEKIQSSLDWREFLEGWYCYVAAGAAGLVFARWMTIVKLLPGVARREFVESLKLLVALFILGAIGWFAVSTIGRIIGVLLR